MKATYAQSPAAGVAAAEVNEIGLEDVPAAISVPWTSRWFPLASSTTVPASTVSVTAVPTVTDPVRTQFIPCSQVSAALIVPPRYPTALTPFPVAEMLVRPRRCVPGYAATA